MSFSKTFANNLKITFETIPETKKYTAPSCTTIKRWVQKVGYYKLTQPKTIAVDALIIWAEEMLLLLDRGISTLELT